MPVIGCLGLVCDREVRLKAFTCLFVDAGQRYSMFPVSSPSCGTGSGSFHQSCRPRLGRGGHARPKWGSVRVHTECCSLGIPQDQHPFPSKMSMSVTAPSGTLNLRLK